MTQEIALSSGWNWVSFNVDITLADLQAALVAAMPTATIMIKAENGDNTNYYGGGRWRGDTFSLDLSRMYRIQTTAAGTISLTGMPINAASQTVTLNQGFNLIAFPLSTSMTLTDAFSTVVGNGDMVKNSEGKSSTYNGRWRGDAFDLEPGQGYVYQRAASGSATFTFPSAK